MRRSGSRSRRLLIILAFLTLILGLSTRHPAMAWPGPVRTFGGDTLWTLMVYWVLGTGMNRAVPGKIAGLALCLSFGVEFSQLYQAPWVNSIRATWLGGLVLGHGFLANDLVCYALGAALGYIMDKTLIYRPDIEMQDMGDKRNSIP